jgi:hypothetical protein
MPVVKCPRVNEYACTARTADGLCTRDFVVLEGPMAQCSYLHEQNVRRAQLRIREVREEESKGQKVLHFWKEDEEERDGSS